MIGAMKEPSGANQVKTQISNIQKEIKLLNEEKVKFDLSTLSLQELVEVYKNITDFIDFLQENKIVLEDSEI